MGLFVNQVGFTPIFYLGAMGGDTKALQELLTPTVEALGYELWGCVLIPQGRYSILRVYIDKTSGITVDDCEQVSRQISALLDVEDPIRGGYTLEVSSPGLDRPLFTLEQFKRFVGAKVNLRLQVPKDNRRHLKGELQTVKGNEITVLIEGNAFTVPLENIARANLLLENLPGRHGS